MVTVLSRRGRCERASIDEVYLDLTEAAEAMLTENPPESLETISEEALKSHILGLHLVYIFIFLSPYSISFWAPLQAGGVAIFILLQDEILFT